MEVDPVTTACRLQVVDGANVAFIDESSQGVGECSVIGLIFDDQGIDFFSPPDFLGDLFGFYSLGLFILVDDRAGDCCEDDEACARPISDRLVKTVLWVATLLVALVITIDFWAPYFY